MKSEHFFIIVLLIIVLYLFFGRKQVKSVNTVKGKSEDNPKGSEPIPDNDDNSENKSLEEAFNPCYTIQEYPESLALKTNSSFYGYFFTKFNEIKTYPLSVVKLREIEGNVEQFAEEIKSVDKPFSQSLIDYFNNLSHDGKRFAKDCLYIKGYIIKDIEGKEYVLESFKEAVTDPLQAKRENASKYASIF